MKAFSLILSALAMTAAVVQGEVRTGTIAKLCCAEVAALETYVTKNYLDNNCLYSQAVIEEPADFSKDNSYAIVQLLHAKDYGVTTLRVNLKDNEVTDAHLNYEITDGEVLDYTVSGQCPDESVEAVFGCSRDCMNNPRAVAAYKVARAAVEKAGVKLVMLEHSAASPQAYLNWLSCKNVKYFTNVGHGTPQQIILSGGSLQHSDFKREFGNDGLSCKLVFFTSCLTHNNPILGAITGANPSHYLAGVNEIAMGRGDTVVGCFWEKIMGSLGSTPVKTAAMDCVNQHYGTWPSDYGITEQNEPVYTCGGAAPTTYEPTSGPTNQPTPAPTNNDCSCVAGHCENGQCSNCLADIHGGICFSNWSREQCSGANFKWCGM